MNKKVFPAVMSLPRSVFSSGPTSAALAAALVSALALGGCAQTLAPIKERAPSQSNVPSPLAELENGTFDSENANAPLTAVDPRATDALDAMSAYLRSLRQFEVNADISTDVVLQNSQNAALLRHIVLKVKRPDRMRAEITGNGNTRGLIDDGRHFTTFDDKQGTYTRNDAPPTLDALVHDLAANWHIEPPLADLFYWGAGKNDDSTITSAQVLGAEKIDARWCTHYVFQQAGAEWELWIEQGRRPLPCHLVVTDTTQPTMPRREATYRWNVAPAFGASTFAFRPKAGAQQIDLKPAADRPSFDDLQ